MKFTCKRQTFLKALAALSRVTPSKSANPIFENIKMTADGDSVLLMATDGDAILVCTLQAEGEHENGSAATPARVLLPMVTALPGELVTVEADSDKVTISWETGNAMLPNMRPDDFPPVPSTGSLDMRMVAGEDFSKALRKTVFAMGDDPLRQMLNNINISVCGNGVAVAASDSHIIAVVRTSVTAVSGDFALNIPSRIVAILKNIMTAEDELQMDFSETGSKAVFRTGEFTLHCTLDRGKYPDYERVIGIAGHHLTMDRNAVLSAVRTVGIFSGTNKRITFHLTGEKVTVHADDIGYTVSAKCEVTGATWDGPGMDIAFNCGIFSELLDSLAPAEEIMLEISAPTKCVLATAVGDAEKSYRAGIMPILVRSK